MDVCVFVLRLFDSCFFLVLSSSFRSSHCRQVTTHFHCEHNTGADVSECVRVCKVLSWFVLQNSFIFLSNQTSFHILMPVPVEQSHKHTINSMKFQRPCSGTTTHNHAHGRRFTFIGFACMTFGLGCVPYILPSARHPD